ncbi:hypothetical protein BpHYR1_044913 [Brachionus plicatilis]|uniref:Uncharacterized protein n=1 Tax=Brachionus plicatilis TaxID=10195 RepID=A0A3M7R7J2_BRAPC|nr:hypothetical protein BpHYR1_044913 [Brachionus plicatilis]
MDTFVLILMKNFDSQGCILNSTSLANEFVSKIIFFALTLSCLIWNWIFMLVFIFTSCGWKKNYRIYNT